MMSFTREVVFISIISFLLLLLGSFVLYKDHRKHVNQSFFFLAFSVLFWTLARFFEDVAGEGFFSHLLLLVDFAAGAFSAFSILLFCLDLVGERWVKNFFVRTSFFVFPVIITALLFLTPFIITGVVFEASGVINPQYGPLGGLYNFIVSLIPLSGIVFIVKGLSETNKEERAPYIYTLIGIFLSLLCVLVTNVFFSDIIAQSDNPEFYSLLGNYSPILLVVFSGYAILRYRLFNAKVIATETFSFLILLGIFLQIFISENIQQVIIRCLIFFATFFIFGLLIQSVDREIKRKEEMEELSRRLAVANQELRRLDAAKSEFISIASHQLRTPLTAIRGYTSLLLEGSYGKITPTVQDIINKIYLVNNRMSQLVEDLLNISRIESGRVQYNFVSAELEPLVVDVVDMFVPMAKDRKLSLKVNLPKKALPALIIDVNKIREVVSNLIDNALKYTKEGGVTVTVSGDTDFASVTVADTGIGVDPQDATRLFEKFTRSAETMKLDVSGTGLGLYVGKNFVEAHGGQIALHSDGPGKGTSFTITLPFHGPPSKKS